MRQMPDRGQCSVELRLATARCDEHGATRHNRIGLKFHAREREGHCLRNYRQSIT